MALSVNVTASMPPEMVQKIDQERNGMSRSEYIRRCIRSDYEEQLTVEESDGFATDSVEA